MFSSAMVLELIMVAYFRYFDRDVECIFKFFRKRFVDDDTEVLEAHISFWWFFFFSFGWKYSWFLMFGEYFDIIVIVVLKLAYTSHCLQIFLSL